MKRYTLAAMSLSIVVLACVIPGGATSPVAIPTTDPNALATIIVGTAQVLAAQTVAAAQSSGPTATLIPDMIDASGVPMRLVPAGTFMMGNDNGNDDEKPAHLVDLPDYYIDKYEVTNKQYAACVSGGGCTPPSGTSSYTRPSYYDNSEFDEFPVINVNWNQANAYCFWAGGELPTEAQWEKAAGWNDLEQKKYVYPWGNNFNGSIVNFCDKNCTLDWADKNSDDGFADTSPIMNYPNGVSPYGAYDMGGNVWEWVNDWYSETYYQSSPSSNPLGPDSGEYRVLRGGSWGSGGTDVSVRSAIRTGNVPTNSSDNLGFRCARGISP